MYGRDTVALDYFRIKGRWEVAMEYATAGCRFQSAGVIGRMGRDCRARRGF